MNFILWTTLSYDHAPVRGTGAYQLASWLRQHGYTVKVIDFCHFLTTEQLVEITKHYINDTTVCIGVSSTFWVPSEVPKTLDRKTNDTEPAWVSTARTQIENQYPNLSWVLGGGGSILPKLKMSWHKIHGDGEDQLLQYLDQLTGRTDARQPFDITTLRKQHHETDFILPQETLGIELGRGCQFKCKFCRFHNVGKKPGTYLRNIECVKEEILYNYENFGTTNYYFIDDTVNEDYDKIVALAAMAKSLPFKLNWVGYIRADLVWNKPDTIQILKESGLKSAFIGIESFNPETARIIGKGWSGKRAKDFLLYLREQWGQDISFYLSFIVGLPKEDKTSLQETVQWLQDNNFKSWRFFPLNIYRSSNLVWKSEFDLNYSKYGYRFPKPLNDMYWESDLWNTNSAIEYSLELNRVIDREQIFTAFILADFVNLGYNIDDIQWKTNLQYDWQDVEQRRNSMIQQYITQSLEHKL